MVCGGSVTTVDVVGESSCEPEIGGAVVAEVVGDVIVRWADECPGRAFATAAESTPPASSPPTAM